MNFLPIHFIGIVFIGLAVTGCSSTTNESQPNFNMTTEDGRMGSQAFERIKSIGGANKICQEANQLFDTYGFTNRGAAHFHIFQDADLTNCPTLNALGNVDGIWSGPPDYIKIHVGHRPEGYYVMILNTNNLIGYEAANTEVEVVKSCVFVHK
jgi:hypothetical protein